MTVLRFHFPRQGAGTGELQYQPGFSRVHLANACILKIELCFNIQVRMLFPHLYLNIKTVAHMID